MGYRINKRVARLVFDDSTEYEGLEVVVALDVPMATMFELERVGSDGADNHDLLRRFGDVVLQEWNLEDDAGPVPADGAGFLSLPIALATTLLAKWSDAAVAVPAPLGPRSSNGRPSEVSTIPTATR